MENNDESTKTLTGFGLNRSQARSYLTLLDIGIASVKDVAKNSNIARPDTYRALSDLQEFGLVEKLITFPTKFKALPITDAISVLMLRRNKETAELGKKATTLMRSLSERNLHIQRSEDNQLTLILGGDAITAKLHKIMQNSKKRICVICPKKDFFQCRQFISETLQETVGNRLTIMLITENHVGPREPKEIRDLKKNPNFQVKYLEGMPTVCFAVFDQKEVIIINTPEIEYSNSSVIWSNTPCLIELAKNYFEHLWNQHNNQ
jgi:sugar-specific transcriptional regulator TrmB